MGVGRCDGERGRCGDAVVNSTNWPAEGRTRLVEGERHREEVEVVILSAVVGGDVVVVVVVDVGVDFVEVEVDVESAVLCRTSPAASDEKRPGRDENPPQSPHDCRDGEEERASRVVPW